MGRVEPLEILLCYLYFLDIKPFFETLFLFVFYHLVSESVRFFGLMATKKIEGRIKVKEEQIVVVHGEMSLVKGEL